MRTRLLIRRLARTHVTPGGRIARSIAQFRSAHNCEICGNGAGKISTGKGMAEKGILSGP